MHKLRATYITRSFLDYRIPVLEKLGLFFNKQFHIIYSADYVPERVKTKAKEKLRHCEIGMHGEKRIGPNEFSDFANTAFRFVYQPNKSSPTPALRRYHPVSSQARL